MPLLQRIGCLDDPVLSATETVRPSYRRIAVPLDGTTGSEHALRFAIAIAQRAHCPLELIHVPIQPPMATELYGAPALGARTFEQSRTIAQRRMGELVPEIEARGVPSSATVLDGAVPTSLADYFHTTDVDLIVMATHRRGRMEHLLFGGMSTSIARHAHIPTLLVHAADSAPSLEPTVEIRQVLLPLDGSEFAAQILPHGSTFAAVMDAEITLISVLRPVLSVATAALDAGPAPTVPLPNAPRGTDHGELTSADIDQTANELRTHDRLPVKTVVLSDGRPAHAIVDYADHHAVDVIAMATHGRGALKRLVAGSVTETVMRTTKLPLLLFRPIAP